MKKIVKLSFAPPTYDNQTDTLTLEVNGIRDADSGTEVDIQIAPIVFSSQMINQLAVLIGSPESPHAPRGDALDQDVMRWFGQTSHLPENVRPLVKTFGQLAEVIIMTSPPCAERTLALTLLIQSKDSAVRAMIAKTLK